MQQEAQRLQALTEPAPPPPEELEEILGAYVVVVPGDMPRTVTVLPRYAPFMEGGIHELESAQLVLGRDLERHAITSGPSRFRRCWRLNLSATSKPRWAMRRRALSSRPRQGATCGRPFTRRFAERMEELAQEPSTVRGTKSRSTRHAE